MLTVVNVIAIDNVNDIAIDMSMRQCYGNPGSRCNPNLDNIDNVEIILDDRLSDSG